jgi:FG-GAP-like repeat
MNVRQKLNFFEALGFLIFIACLLEASAHGGESASVSKRKPPPIGRLYVGATTDQRSGHVKSQRARPLAFAGTNSLTLNSYTPIVPFLGNRTIIVRDPLATTPPQIASGLLREADCSLSVYTYSFGASLLPPFGNAALEKNLGGVDRYLHTLSELGTTPGTFASGCAVSNLGIDSQPGALLGRFSNGDYLGAFVMVNNFSLRLARAKLDGSIVSSSIFATGISDSISTVDLNGDGFDDMVIPWVTGSGAGASGLGVAVSNSAGTYAAPVIYTLDGTQFTSRTSVEDINGDGKPDIVAVTSSISDVTSASISTFLGKGDGTFTIGPVRNNIGFLGRLVIADFNDDGKKDIVTAGGSFLAGNGDGSFAASVPAFRLLGSIFLGITVGDFNADGKLDIATTSSLGRLINVFLGNGNGTFAPGQSYSGIAGTNYVRASDINGDGHTDLVVGVISGTLIAPGPPVGRFVQFLFGRGDGTFVGAQSIFHPGINSVSNVDGSFALADFDGNGRSDVLMSSPRGFNDQSLPGHLTIFPGLTAGELGSPTMVPIDQAKAYVVGTGDLDGDGMRDIVYAAQRLATLRGLANGAFASETSAPLSATPINLAVADFNGDGRSDVALVLEQNFTSSRVVAYFGQADGALSGAVTIDTAQRLRQISTGDFNGDGRADVVLVDSGDPSLSGIAGSVRLFSGNANNTFTPAGTLTPAFLVSGLTTGDLNKDGKLDVIVTAYNSIEQTQLFAYLGQGNGLFNQPLVKSFNPGILGVSGLEIADFNGDGRADVAITRDDTTGFINGNGDGTFGTDTLLAIANDGGQLKAGDIDGDGQPDLVMAASFAGLTTLVNRTSQWAVPVAPPKDFQLSLSANEATVRATQSAETVVSLSFGDGFSETITFSCADLPANATCSFNPASLTPTGGAGSTTLTIGTGTGASQTTTTGLSSGGGNGPPILTNGISSQFIGWYAFSGMGFVALSLRRRNRSHYAPAMIASLLAFNAISGCGGGGGDSSTGSKATPTGAYTITVKATAGSTTKSVPYTLTVQ